MKPRVTEFGWAPKHNAHAFFKIRAVSKIGLGDTYTHTQTTSSHEPTFVP
jgi:hypothetical protein